jgi:ferredoxin
VDRRRIQRLRRDKLQFAGERAGKRGLEDTEMKKFRHLPGVSTLRLNSGACVGCAMCTVVCPHGVLEMKRKTVAIVDPDGCMECGACARNCPVDAIQVTPGVGCAAYIIQSWIKGKGGAVCRGDSCC